MLFMEEFRDDKVCSQSYYADNKNAIYDSDLLEDIRFIVEKLNHQVVSIYEEWDHDYAKKLYKEEYEDLANQQLPAEWFTNIINFFYTDKYRYIRFKTVYGVFTLVKNELCTPNLKIAQQFRYCIYDYDGYDVASLKAFFATLNFQSIFYSTVPETRPLDTVYFAIRDIPIDVYITNQIYEWIRPGYESLIFCNEEWEKNKLIVCFSVNGMADCYAVTAPLELVKKFFPEALSLEFEIISPDGTPSKAELPFWGFKSLKEGSALFYR